jgi:hypothetical protein
VRPSDLRASAAGHRARGRTNQLFLCGATGGRRPARRPAPDRPVGCMRGLGSEPRRPTLQAATSLGPPATSLALGAGSKDGYRAQRSPPHPCGSESHTGWSSRLDPRCVRCASRSHGCPAGPPALSGAAGALPPDLPGQGVPALATAHQGCIGKAPLLCPRGALQRSRRRAPVESPGRPLRCRSRSRVCHQVFSLPNGPRISCGDFHV